MLELHFISPPLTSALEFYHKIDKSLVSDWPLVVLLEQLLQQEGIILEGLVWGRSHWSTCTIYCMCTPVQKWPDADLLGKVIHIGFLSARQYSKDGTEHAATVATALYSGIYPGRHGNSKSGRILRRGEARGGAGQWTRWRVFQNPGRSRCIATKCKEVKNNKLRIFHTKIVRSASAICWQGEYLKAL